MIHEVGLSGTVDTIWDGEFQRKTNVKLSDGMQSEGISHKSKRIAEKVICFAVLASAKHSCIGRMIVGSFRDMGYTKRGA